MAYLRVSIAVVILSWQFLLVGSTAFGASITGDEFTATISEGGAVIGSATGIAGMSGDDIAFDVTIEWLDEDTFEFDFFGFEDITLVLSDLDFMEAGSPVDIVGVSEARAEFGWDYNSSFDANSITIEYPFLSGNAIGDGEIISFDVITVPEPATVMLCCFAAALLLCRGRVAP